MKRLISIILTVAMVLGFAALLPIDIDTAQAFTTTRDRPIRIDNTPFDGTLIEGVEPRGEAYTWANFTNGETVSNKVQGRLPALGWNSWNAFGSGNTEANARAMADKFVELGLVDLGYEYIVLDDGCYQDQRVNGRLAPHTTRFPSGFKALADYVNARGLKLGMYNDIGTRLCAGGYVGTAGFEDVDAQSYTEWGIQYLKVDNCYYMWDNATFSDGANFQYACAPRIRSITVSGNNLNVTQRAATDGILLGEGATRNTSGDGYVDNIGTVDGTGSGRDVDRPTWAELAFNVTAPADGTYNLVVNYASGTSNGVGRWLQVAVGDRDNEKRFYDNLLPASSNNTTFINSPTIQIELKAGTNLVRLMNHRRQENTLISYSAMLDAMNKANANNPDYDLVLSICEWGKTQPHEWGYKVGNSWRVLNDITFSVGTNGSGTWSAGGTDSICSQYNKAVIQDEYAGLDKGWNDPDMMVIGMRNITTKMSETHMTMWCMLNSPIMLGYDLRRTEVGDDLHKIIANADVIGLNQDPLGIQAKRIYTSANISKRPDVQLVTNNSRIDVLAKPLADGSVAISFFNLDSSTARSATVNVDRIMEYIGHKMVNPGAFAAAEVYNVYNVWTKETTTNETGIFSVANLPATDNYTIIVSPAVAKDPWIPDVSANGDETDVTLAFPTPVALGEGFSVSLNGTDITASAGAVIGENKIPLGIDMADFGNQNVLVIKNIVFPGLFEDQNMTLTFDIAKTPNTMKVIVKEKVLTLQKGATAMIATGLTSSDMQFGVSFASSDTDVATVSSGGVVTARAAGECEITLSVGEYAADTFLVSVYELTAPPQLDSSKWNIRNPGGTYTLNSPYSMTVTPVGGAMWSSYTARIFEIDAPAGDFTVEVKLDDWFPGIGSGGNNRNYATAGLIVANAADLTRFVAVSRRNHSEAANIGYRYFGMHNRTGSGNPTELTGPAETNPQSGTAYLRLVRTGNSFEGFSSYDGVTWTSVGTVSNTFGTSIKIGVFATEDDATSNGPAIAPYKWENFKVNGELVSFSAPKAGGSTGSLELSDDWQITNPANGTFNVVSSTKLIMKEVGQRGMWGTYNAPIVSTAPGTSDYTVDVKLSDYALGHSDYAGVGLAIYLDSSNFLLFARRNHPGNDDYNVNGQLLMMGHRYPGVPNGNVDENYRPDPNPEINDIWLRLVKEGNTVTGYTSFDGETWTASGLSVTHAQIANLNSARVGLFGIENNARGNDATYTWENFTINGKVIPFAKASAGDISMKLGSKPAAPAAGSVFTAEAYVENEGAAAASLNLSLTAYDKAGAAIGTPAVVPVNVAADSGDYFTASLTVPAGTALIKLELKDTAGYAAPPVSWGIPESVLLYPLTVDAETAQIAPTEDDKPMALAAKIEAVSEKSSIDGPIEFVISAGGFENAFGGRIKFSIENLDAEKATIEPLNGFTLNGMTDLTKGDIWLSAPLGTMISSLSDFTEIVKISFGGVAVGDATVTLDSILINYEEDGYTYSLVIENITEDTAVTDVVLSYSIYDINRDGEVDETDVAIAAKVAQYNETEARWTAQIQNFITMEGSRTPITAAMANVSDTAVLPGDPAEINLFDLMDIVGNFTV